MKNLLTTAEYPYLMYILQLRIPPCYDILWNLDKNTAVRYSHRNADVQALYREFLKAPLSERSHHLLHTDHNGWKMPREK